MKAQNLYEPSKAILASGLNFVRVDAHDARAAESADHLWIEHTPHDDLCEGEVISISPATNDGAAWYVGCNSANKTGGWTTHWFSTGSEQEIQKLVTRALNSNR